VSFPDLPAGVLEGETREVARRLLGCILIHETPDGLAAGEIVETESYGPDDPASHAFRGKTARNRSMFLEPGSAYIYRVYGLHHCLNVVTAPTGTGEAVLIRALRPLAGIELMQARRGILNEYVLCKGPANLVKALGVRPEQDGQSLLKGPLRLAGPIPDTQPLPIVATTRIGISQAREIPSRFLFKGSPWVSGARPTGSG
jgi:DNA-3-methyladenine glycosylase